MATPPPPGPAAPHLDTVLSFSDVPSPAAPAAATPAFSDAGGSDSDADSDDFEFAFAPPLSPLTATGGGRPINLAPADDLFAHGRIVAAYPLFDRHLLLPDDQASSASTAPPSPDRDSYCEWAPRSAPGSPSRSPRATAAAAGAGFPKSASTGEARPFWRLRDLVAGNGNGGRSHSDGKEKFLFLQPSSSNPATPAAAAAKPSKAAAASAQKQGKKKTKGFGAGNGKTAAAPTEMDMATAHRLFYGKPGGAAAASAAGERTRQQSYLPYRPVMTGFFAAAHALGRSSHHPY